MTRSLAHQTNIVTGASNNALILSRRRAAGSMAWSATASHRCSGTRSSAASRPARRPTSSRKNVPIDLPGPRLPHDMAYTEHYAVLNDMPLFWEPELIERGLYAARFHPELPSRLGVIPRRGASGDIRWFDFDPTYVLHWTNAYESGDEVIVEGFFQGCPAPASAGPPPAGLSALVDAVESPVSPAVAAAGQAVIVARRPGAPGLIGLAWAQMVRVTSPQDPLLRQFASFWLGRGAPRR